MAGQLLGRDWAFVNQASKTAGMCLGCFLVNPSFSVALVFGEQLFVGAYTV